MKLIYKEDLKKCEIFTELSFVQKLFFIKSANVEKIQNALNVLINTGKLKDGLTCANKFAVQELFEIHQNQIT